MEVRSHLQALAGFLLTKSSKFHRTESTVISRTCRSFTKVRGLLIGPGIKLPSISQLYTLYYPYLKLRSTGLLEQFVLTQTWQRSFAQYKQNA